MSRNFLAVLAAVTTLMMGSTGIWPFSGASAKSADPVSSLQDIISSPQSGTYHVVYSYKSVDPLSGQIGEQRATYYRSGDQQRLDMVTQNADGQMVNTQAFLNRKDSQLTICFQEAVDKWNCQRLTGDDALLVADSSPFFFFDAPRGLLKYVVDDAKTRRNAVSAPKDRKIAGQSGQSFTYNLPPPSGGQAEFAVTKDGLLLLVDIHTSQGDNPLKIQVVEVSNQVSDGDFTPPAAPAT